MSQPPIPTFVQDDLARVDDIILERISAQSAVIRAAGDSVVGSAGKRLRAALTLLSAHMGHYDLGRVIHAAAAVELIHSASLVHDDLIDEAERRRGLAAIRTRWNSDVALMVGDYLFALAASEMALAPDPRIIAYFSQAVMTICEGELAPVTSLTPASQAVEQYMYKIGCKTAALFEAGCKAGLVCGGGTQEQVDALGRFGYDLGLAFQIVDDLLDMVGDAALLGRPVGRDLREGTITLPLIHAVASGADPRLSALIDQEAPDDAAIAWAISEIQRVGGDASAMAEAHRFAARALTHLRLFPNSAARQATEMLVAYAVERAH